MKLTAQNVEMVFLDCLFKAGEPTENYLKIEGIVNKFGFHPGRIDKHKNEIYEMLKQLPDEFQKKSGSGMSFLNACNDKDGNQWTGLHSIMEQLMTIGIAVNKVKYCLPREMWNSLPGAVPYFTVL